VSTATVPARSRAHPLRGAGAPGLGGYVLAVLASAVCLGLVLGVAEVIAESETLAFAPEDLIYVVLLPLGVAALAVIYGLPAALLGCLVVHLVCLRVPLQGVHVAMAGLAGVAAGVVYGGVLFDGFYGLWLPLGIATMVGRAAVIPLVRGRR